MLRFIKFAVFFSAATLLFGISSQDARASTYSCTGSLYGSSGIYNGVYDSLCTGNNTANQASTVATSSAVLAAAATQSASLVSGRISNAVGGKAGVSMAANGFSASTGKSAGNHGERAGAWVSGSWSDVEDDNTDTAFDGDVYTVMGGIDYRVTDATVIGIAIGYEDVDLDTAYNASPTTGANGSLEGDGYTVAPYIGVQLSPNATADLTVGYSDLEYDTVRFDPNSGNQITGSTDADRYFVNAGVNGTHMFDDHWRLRGRASVFYASEEKDAFTETESTGATISQAESDTDLGQVSLDARLGYMFRHVEPYALAGATFDFSKDEAAVATGQQRASFDDEDFGAKFGGGINLELGPNVTGGVEAYTVEFRDDYSEYTVTGGLRVNF